MKKTPYKIFSWLLMLFLWGPLIAGIIWIAAALGGAIEETPALIALSLTTGVLAFGGLIGFLYGTYLRAKLSKAIVFQNSNMAVVVHDPKLRGIREVQYFAQDVINLHIHKEIASTLRSYFWQTRAISLERLPFIFITIQRDPPKWEFLGKTFLARGVSKGSKCTVSIQDTWEQTAKLINHEIAHIVFNFVLHMRSDHKNQHELMVKSGIEASAYLNGIFSKKYTII